jgi:ABC-type amino acid transport substrate-binding protein
VQQHLYFGIDQTLSKVTAMPQVSPAVISDLAPTGKLRVGINLSNFLLTRTDAATGEHGGVAVDLGRELGRQLGVPVEIVPFPRPGALAEAAISGVGDVTLESVRSTSNYKRCSTSTDSLSPLTRMAYDALLRRPPGWAA